MDPFIGEIRLFAFPRIPTGWAACNGQMLSISNNPALYALIGTTYGGDGIQSFALPDLRGRVPIGFGQGPGLRSYGLGQAGGAETHTLVTAELPAHGHALTSTTNPATTATPGTTVHLATAQPNTKALYAPTANVASYTAMAPQAVQPTGGNGAHANMMPSLVMSFCIATDGVFPSN